MQPSVAAAVHAVRNGLSRAARGLVEREALVEVVALAAVAREHVLVVGPPGTAKSEAVRRVARVLGGRYFEYLLGRFTEPSELFGPVDLAKLRQGVVETQTRGMLPEAQIAFLDEVFLGSTAILNTLLAILNERRFRRGSTDVACPLEVCVGASNALPEDESLAAFADRFLVRVFVSPIPDPRIEELLAGGHELASTPMEGAASIEHLRTLAAAARTMDPAPVRAELAHALRLLRKNGIALTDRRAVKLQSLVTAAAVLDGRDAVGVRDLWPIGYIVPTAEEQALARDVLRDLLDRSESEVLPAAAAEASLGPAARAARIARAAHDTLEQAPPDEDTASREAWKLKLEGIAREIDAGFARDRLPENLAEVRARIVALVGPAEPASS